MVNRYLACKFFNPVIAHFSNVQTICLVRKTVDKFNPEYQYTAIDGWMFLDDKKAGKTDNDLCDKSLNRCEEHCKVKNNPDIKDHIIKPVTWKKLI